MISSMQNTSSFLPHMHTNLLMGAQYEEAECTSTAQDTISWMSVSKDKEIESSYERGDTEMKWDMPLSSIHNSMAAFL